MARSLAVGLTASGRDARAATKPGPTSAGRAAAGAGATTTTAAAAGAAPATTTTVTAAAAETTTTTAGDGNDEADAPDDTADESDPVPARVRATPPPTDPPPPEPVPAGLTRQPNVELEVLTLTNMDRGNNGVPPIARDSCMDAEASDWAYAMGESNTMAHSAGGGAAVQGCRGSPSHRPHILDPNFRAVGIGVWAEPNGRCWFQVYFGS